MHCTDNLFSGQNSKTMQRNVGVAQFDPGPILKVFIIKQSWLIKRIISYKPMVINGLCYVPWRFIKNSWVIYNLVSLPAPASNSHTPGCRAHRIWVGMGGIGHIQELTIMGNDSRFIGNGPGSRSSMTLRSYPPPRCQSYNTCRLSDGLRPSSRGRNCARVSEQFTMKTVEGPN